MQYTTLHDIKRVITSFENSINKASNKVYKLTIGQYPHISLDKARDITTEYNSILQSLESVSYTHLTLPTTERV